MSDKPFMIIRAQIDPAIREEFQRWYFDEQRRQMLIIPGVVGAYHVKSAHSDTGWMALLKFYNEVAMQEALSSAEATRTREAWQRWMPYLKDMTIEIYTSLGALTPYHHRN